MVLTWRVDLINSRLAGLDLFIVIQIFNIEIIYCVYSSWKMEHLRKKKLQLMTQWRMLMIWYVNHCYIEDITWLRRNMKFIFECSNLYLDKFHMSKQPCNILFII